jgi:cytoskeleton protein RodZ
MSKRRHKNKFHFHPRPAQQVGGEDQQSLLPLTVNDTAAPDSMPVKIAATEETMPPLRAESGLSPVFAEPAPAPELHLTAPAVAPDAPLGQRLRAAREARGLSCEAASHALRLPVTVVKSLEAEQFERIGHGVFLRGYLGKYLQLLDLPLVLADRVVQDHAEPPPLTTSGTISHPRYLFERYSGSALYLILTGVIVVPAVLLAVRAGFDQNLARITSLDTPPAVIAVPVTEHANTASFMSTGTTQSPPGPAPVAAPARAEEPPLVASMTPFPAATESRAAVISAPVVELANRLHLSLAHASWVEIVDTDGRKLEYGLLPAGSERDYASNQAMDIRIGNADAATLSVNGRPQDLASFRHANVAHLKIADGAAGAVHGGG